MYQACASSYLAEGMHVHVTAHDTRFDLTSCFLIIHPIQGKVGSNWPSALPGWCLCICVQRFRPAFCPLIQEQSLSALRGCTCLNIQCLFNLPTKQIRSDPIWDALITTTCGIQLFPVGRDTVRPKVHVYQSQAANWSYFVSHKEAYHLERG